MGDMACGCVTNTSSSAKQKRRLIEPSARPAATVSMNASSLVGVPAGDMGRYGEIWGDMAGEGHCAGTVLALCWHYIVLALCAGTGLALC